MRSARALAAESDCSLTSDASTARSPSLPRPMVGLARMPELSWLLSTLSIAANYDARLSQSTPDQLTGY
jgi:hypothetical protein